MKGIFRIKKLTFFMALTAFIALTLVALGFSFLERSQEAGLINARGQYVPATEYAKDELLVKLRHGISFQEFHESVQSLGAMILKIIPQIDVYHLKIKNGTSLQEFLHEMNQRPEVEYAEPNYRLYLASTIPNDTYFHYQWGLRNVGQPIAPPNFNFPIGKPGADIKASEAWDIETGQDSVVVAVVDTGVDITHPDLVNKIFSPGKDFVDDDDEARDEHGHGTHVAGIIAADTDNDMGIAGICWKCKILPVRVFDQYARGYTDDVIAGIVWAADQGIRVMNLSLGGPDITVSKSVEEAIKYAYGNGVVIVAAGGNQGIFGVWYPAAYDNYVLAAAATDNGDVHITLETTGGEWGCNYGPEIDVAAPGLHILSTWGIGLPRRQHMGWRGYIYIYGTSMATAFVSGVAAEIVSSTALISNAEVMDIIRDSADDINAITHPGKDIYIGYGRVNLRRALEMLNTPNPPLNFSGTKVLNRSLSQASYINVLKWLASPEKQWLTIIKYKIYLVENGSLTLLTELASDKFEYWHRRVKKDKAYTYALVAQSSKFLDSEAVYVSIK